MSEPNHSYPCTRPVGRDEYARDALRLEAVTACVGFDDMLDFTLTQNHAHLDTMIVVTSHGDRKTKLVAHKHGAICVPTDLFQKNGRHFNKGAAINAGLAYFQYRGWRLHLDSDIMLPDNFRRVLFNHTHLDERCLYGADRIDVIGPGSIKGLPRLAEDFPQYRKAWNVDATHGRHMVAPLGSRGVSPLDGYLPLGYFQLWHARERRNYPFSLGTAAHDDTMFSRLWPEALRRLLPTVLVYHICTRKSEQGENWDGNRKMPRLK